MSLILTVDDDELMLHIVSDILMAEHYEIIMASNGQQAIEILNKEWNTNQRRPALIISDLEMPAMNGTQLSDYLNADPCYKTIPFILLTGSSNPDKYYHQKGIDEVIIKPFKLEDLLRPVRKLIKEQPHKNPCSCENRF